MRFFCFSGVFGEIEESEPGGCVGVFFYGFLSFGEFEVGDIFPWAAADGEVTATASEDQVAALRGVFFAEQCAKSSMAPSGLSTFRTP